MRFRRKFNITWWGWIEKECYITFNFGPMQWVEVKACPQWEQ